MSENGSGILPNMPLTQKRKGRKPKPYVCHWNNETIDGLYSGPKNRWRIVEIGRAHV